MSFQLEDIDNYFETLAIANKLSKHTVDGRKSFYPLTQKESSALPTNAASPYLAITSYSGAYAGDAYQQDKKVSINIQFLHKAKTTSEADKEEAFTIAETLMDQFVSKMRLDAADAGICFWLSLINFGRMSYERIGPVGQQDFGYELNIPITIDSPEYDVNNWEV